MYLPWKTKIDFILFLPSIELIWNGVFIFSLPFFSRSLANFALCSDPLNSSLLCTRVTSANFDNSIAQSKAESPPPKIQTFLFSKVFLSFIE